MAAAIDPESTLQAPPRDLEQIEYIDNSLTFPSFTAETAWGLGCALRTRLLPFSKPVVIDISLAHGHHCLFHATTRSGTSPDNDTWVARKRNTVLRFGYSTWYMHNKYQGDEEAFAKKFGLAFGGSGVGGGNGVRAGDYAIHGGGWPVRVKGVEGIVAVVVVSGLKQDQDHGVIVQTVSEVLEAAGVEGLEKRKED
ncbi:hypothetical protein K431DRAFT_214039 [Polychaeton citri CBS 116435]|uniref:DUF967 domain protein n=1 Tax=Polychaeton citri CBS 116435 TaxID=1314669 RepID=A0A9P4QKB8_9PEZI|nr:hypothetical protein K431DRAFT_214039 [Polychaeton citri CBS 116435]